MTYIDEEPYPSGTSFGERHRVREWRYPAGRENPAGQGRTKP